MWVLKYQNVKHTVYGKFYRPLFMHRYTVDQQAPRPPPPPPGLKLRKENGNNYNWKPVSTNAIIKVSGWMNQKKKPIPLTPKPFAVFSAHNRILLYNVLYSVKWWRNLARAEKYKRQNIGCCRKRRKINKENFSRFQDWKTWFDWLAGAFSMEFIKFNLKLRCLPQIQRLFCTGHVASAAKVR